MSTLIENLISATAESNLSMRTQIKKQHLSLKKLEQKLKQRKQATLNQPLQLKIPPGKMMIKPKSMVMRVRNDKAILDELGQTRHKHDSDEEDVASPKSPKFDSKTAPNLIIQSQVQNDPAPIQSAASTVHPQVAGSVPMSGVYAPPPAPVYYSKPHAPPYHPRHPPVVYQPVQYVEEYVQDPPVYKIRSKSHARVEPPVIIYEHERSPPPSPVHYHRPPRPVEYRSAPYPDRESWGHSSPRHPSPPRHRSAHSPPSYREEYVTKRYRSGREPGRQDHFSSYPSYSPSHAIDPSRKHNYPKATRDRNGVIKHDIRQASAGSNVQFKVLVSNLHPSVSIHDIEELFSAIDTVEHIQMLYPGVAEVIYLREESAIASLDKYHNRDLDGQPMQVTYSAVHPNKWKQAERTKVKPTTRPPNSHNTSTNNNNNNRLSLNQHMAPPHVPGVLTRPAWPKKQKLNRSGGNKAMRGGQDKMRRGRHPGGGNRVLPPHSDTESSVHSFTVTV